MKQPRLWGRELLDFETLDSTNRWLVEQARPGLAVLARRQDAGRGRLGRRWEPGPPGQLYASFYVAPGEWPHFTPALTLLVGLAVYEAAEAQGAPDLSLKWPNDLLSGRRKLAGILCEGASGGVVCGVGFNLRGDLEDYPAPLRGKLTNLEHLGLEPPEPKAFFEDILRRAEAWAQTCRSGLEPLIERWEAASGSLGAPVAFDWQGAERQGTILGLSPQGAVCIASGGEELELIGGELRYLDSPYGLK